jgi:hypothetical protein
MDDRELRAKALEFAIRYYEYVAATLNGEGDGRRAQRQQIVETASRFETYIESGE